MHPPLGSPASSERTISPDRIRAILQDDSRPIFPARFLGASENLKIKAITWDVQRDQNFVISRPLTDEEVRALATAAATKIDRMSLARPAIVATAAFMTLRGRKTFRFPFWQPKWQNTHPTVFPTVRTVLLRDRWAIGAWHAFRFMAYHFMASIMLTPLFSYYAISSSVTAKALDERLHDFLLETTLDPMNQKALQTIQQRAGLKPIEFPAPDDPRVKQALDARRRAFIRDIEQRANPQEREALMKVVEQMDSSRQQLTEKYRYGLESESPSQPPRQSQQPSQQQPFSWTSSPSSSSSSSDLEAGNLFDSSSNVGDDDDASPVAKPYRNQSQSSEDGMSAWDRIRQNAAAQTPTHAQTSSQAQAQTPSEAQSREQAQRQFDQLLEAERAGSEDKNRRWSDA